MDFSDFTSQIPISILCAPFFFGALYIVLMVYIFRRGQKRRKARREAQLAAMPGAVQEGTGAAWAMPPEMRDLPEPDIDALLMLDSPATTPSQPAAPARTETVRAVAEKPVTVAQTTQLAQTSEPDWLSAITPVQEATPVMSTTSTPSTNYDPSAPLPSDAVEVMRIYRDLTDGRIIVQINNNNYRSMGDIKNPDLARRFAALVGELWSMVNSASKIQTGTQPAVAAESGPKIGLLSGSDEESKKPNIMRSFARAAMGQTSAPADNTPAGIASAVEEFLQYKLSNTPELSMRSIHIRPSHDHGIRIEVDGRYFDGIGDVPDTQVREFLQKMMREWEARQ